MRLQIWGEGFLGELPELRGQTQALELSHLIVASVVRIRHGVCSQTGEMSGRTSTLSLSVVQTTKPKPIAQDHWNSAGELFCSDSFEEKQSHLVEIHICKFRDFWPGASRVRRIRNA